MTVKNIETIGREGNPLPLGIKEMNSDRKKPQAFLPLKSLI